MSETGTDVDAWPIPKVYLRYAPPDLVDDYGNEVCALIYHIIRGVGDGQPESGGELPYLRHLPEALLEGYGTELPEILRRSALGCLDPTASNTETPAYLARLTPAEIEEWGERLFRLTGGICEAFRGYPFLQQVPEHLLLDFGEADTVDFVVAVVRGMVEGQAHPEWSSPQSRYVTPAMSKDWGEMVDILGRSVRGIMEGPAGSGEQPACVRHLSEKEQYDYGEFFPFVAAICDGWRRHNPAPLPQRHRAGEPMKWDKDGVILDEYLIERELGRGGMGLVWLVKSNSTGRRFAVKQTLLKDEKHRKAFLTELQTWIDLPEHPNIVPCRFFRTVGDEIVIFADYIDGGSLADWIAKKKLTKLEQILDVAIQFAWGLHAIHERGLIHQDVKPGNVLMTSEGVPMVMDFGLARARMCGVDGSFVSPALPPGKQSMLVSVGGMTPAYASPEQRTGQPLSRKTDIWSWGVSVLDMFMGGASCPYGGHIAAAVLASVVERGLSQADLPTMPKEVEDILRSCFQAEQNRRCETLGKVVERLETAYYHNMGTRYARALDHIERRGTPKAYVTARRTREGTEWTEPRKWLEEALRADGREPAEAAIILSNQVASQRGLLVAELAAYDEARRIYERLVKAGRKDLELGLATLCMEAAFVHLTADDAQGGLGLFDLAIQIRERLVGEGRQELAGKLAMTYQNKALALHNLGEHRSGVELFDRAINVYERLVNQEGQQGLANELGSTYMNKANALGALGDKRCAVELYDQAIIVYDRLVKKGNSWEVSKKLGMTYQNKALMLCHLGDTHAGVVLYGRAIALYERLLDKEGRRELAADLALMYQNKAVALGDVDDELGAVAFYERAIELYERLVGQEGRSELAHCLARTYMNKAVALSTLGDKRGAVTLYEQVIGVYERLVNLEGRRELANDLAMAYMNKAIALSAMGDSSGAVPQCDQAIAIRQRLVTQERRHELAGDLAWAIGTRGVVLVKMGETHRGEREARAAMAVLRDEIERTGRVDLQSALAWIAGQVES